MALSTPRVDTVPAYFVKKAGAYRTYGINLVQWTEIRNGDILIGVPVVTVTAGDPSLDGAPGIGVAQVQGARIVFAAGGGTPGTYTLTFQCQTAGGANLSGDVILRVT